MSNYARITCVLALSACVLSAQPATSVTAAVQTTGMVGVADSQTAQLNLLNPGVPSPAAAAICIANVSFVDANGVVVKSGTLTVPPGQSRALDVRSDTDLSIVSGDRREIRALISIPGILPPAGSTSVVLSACKLIPTLEIFDTVTGRTLVTLGHVVDVSPVPATHP
jgi:hypothetical protein